MTLEQTTIEELQARLDALPDENAMASATAALLAEAAKASQKRQTLAHRIRAVRDARSMLAELGPEIATKTAYRDAIASSREKLCAELMAEPQPRSHYEMVSLKLSIAVCDRGLGAIADTGCSLETLRLGVLLREAGVSWLGTQLVVERRLKELQARRNDAQQRLDAALRDETV